MFLLYCGQKCFNERQKLDHTDFVLVFLKSVCLYEVSDGHITSNFITFVVLL